MILTIYFKKDYFFVVLVFCFLHVVLDLWGHTYIYISNNPTHTMKSGEKHNIYEIIAIFLLSFSLSLDQNKQICWIKNICASTQIQNVNK